MARLTEMQRLFISAKKDGLTNRSAAIHAGYSVCCADQRASTLMRNPAILREIGCPTTRESAKKQLYELREQSSEDPVAFLMSCMNNPALTFSLRFEAAKALLPYQVSRPVQN